MNTDIDWNDEIKKESRGDNTLDLGKVQEVSSDLIGVQNGYRIQENF